jgi:hypothetical protein
LDGRKRAAQTTILEVRIMPSAAAIASNNVYGGASDGSSSVVLYKTLFALANASAMNGSYTGNRPVTAVVEFIESLTGETSLTKQFRRDHSAIINEEAKAV